MLRNPTNSQGKSLGKGKTTSMSRAGQDEHTAYLLHHPIRLELVTVGETTDQSPLTVLIKTERVHLALGPAEALMVLGLRVLAMLADQERATAGLVVVSIGPTPVTGPALVCLAVEQEIAQNAGRTPEEAVCPSLDAALVLVEHEDGAGGDHLALGIYEATSDAGDETATCGLEDDEGVACCLYPPAPWGLCPAAAADGCCC